MGSWGRRALLVGALSLVGCTRNSTPVYVPALLKLEDGIAGHVARIRDAVKDKDPPSHERSLAALQALELVRDMLAQAEPEGVVAGDVEEGFNIFLDRYAYLELALRARQLLGPGDELEHGDGSIGISFRVKTRLELESEIRETIRQNLRPRKLL